jgi:hypothetical protein
MYVGFLEFVKGKGSFMSIYIYCWLLCVEPRFDIDFGGLCVLSHVLFLIYILLAFVCGAMF